MIKNRLRSFISDTLRKKESIKDFTVGTFCRFSTTKALGDEDTPKTEPHKLFQTLTWRRINHDIVFPAAVTPKLSVPDHIRRPEYAETGVPAAYPHKKPEIKSAKDIEMMKAVCQLTRLILDASIKDVKPGIPTDFIDKYLHSLVTSHGAYPTPLNYRGFPKSVCTSVNNVACHGIPDTRPLKDGDILSVDCMVYLDGFHGDCTETISVGNVDDRGKQLIAVARESTDAGIKVCGPGVPLYEIGKAIEELADRRGMSVIPAFTGHGIGTYVHGPPEIIHYEDYSINNSGVMKPGMVFTVEPVISEGSEHVQTLKDGWTVVTLDDSRAAQFEETILITEDGHEILTARRK